MKQFFIKLWSDVFEPKQEKKHRTKYLLVSSNKYYSMPHTLGEDRAFKCIEFSTKKEANHFIKNYIAKAERNLWFLYKRV